MNASKLTIKHKPYYKSRAELPRAVRKKVPLPGQDMYISAFNDAMYLYQVSQKNAAIVGNSRITSCHKHAWNELKRFYTIGKDGKWRLKMDTDISLNKEASNDKKRYVVKNYC